MRINTDLKCLKYAIWRFYDVVKTENAYRNIIYFSAFFRIFLRFTDVDAVSSLFIYVQCISTLCLKKPDPCDFLA